MCVENLRKQCDINIISILITNHFQPTLSNHRDQYNVSWIVQSYAPILEYRLFYRKQSENSNTNANNDVLHYDKFVSNTNKMDNLYCLNIRKYQKLIKKLCSQTM